MHRAIDGPGERERRNGWGRGRALFGEGAIPDFDAHPSSGLLD